MATEDRTEELGTGQAAETNGGGKPTGVEGLKARVAAKRGAQATAALTQGGGATPGGNGATGASTPLESVPEDAPVTAPADAGVPDGEITTAASDELAKLAARREAQEAADDDDPETRIMRGLGEEGDSEMAAIQANPPEGETAYERTQRELATARERPSGKGKADGKGSKLKEKAKLKKEKDAEKARLKKEKEKEKTKEKTQKQKDAEARRKQADQEKRDRRAKAEKERKETLAKKKAEAAAARAARIIPDPIKKLNKAGQAAFIEDYAVAGPKTDRNPNGIGMRRAKADRGDFAAGYVMAMRRMARQRSGGEAVAGA